MPEQALVPQGDEQFVYKVVDGKAARSKVEVGQRRDGRVEVLSGVGADDTIVTAGQLKLRDGMPVRVAAAAGAAGGYDNNLAARSSGERQSRQRCLRRAQDRNVEPARAEVLIGGPGSAVDATARDLHQAARLRDGAVAHHPAGRAHFLHAAVGARVSAHRRARRQRRHDVPRRVGRGGRVAGDQDSRGLAVGHRGRRGDDLAKPLRGKPDQRPVHAETRPGLRGRRRPRQGRARARPRCRTRSTSR